MFSRSLQSKRPRRHRVWLHPSFFSSSTASLWACKHKYMLTYGDIHVEANQKSLCSPVDHLFVFLCASWVILGFAEPQQSFLFVLHGHVGLPKHQQVFAVEVWVN